jgi:hypothetical protein
MNLNRNPDGTFAFKPAVLSGQPKPATNQGIVSTYPTERTGVKVLAQQPGLNQSGIRILP